MRAIPHHNGIWPYSMMRELIGRNPGCSKFRSNHCRLAPASARCRATPIASLPLVPPSLTGHGRHCWPIPWTWRRPLRRRRDDCVDAGYGRPQGDRRPPGTGDSSDNNYGDREKKETISKRLVFSVSQAKCAWQCFSPTGSDETVLFFEMKNWVPHMLAKRIEAGGRTE
jgi:hypothetical protein